MEFKLEREQIDVTSMFEGNPDWHFTCPGCGSDISILRKPRPKFVKWIYYTDDYETVKVAKCSYHCKVCWTRVSDEEVSKATRPSTSRTYMAGLLSWSLEIELLARIDEGEYSLTFEIEDIGRLAGKGQLQLVAHDLIGDTIVFTYKSLGVGELKRLHGWKVRPLFKKVRKVGAN